MKPKHNVSFFLNISLLAMLLTATTSPATSRGITTTSLLDPALLAPIDCIKQERHQWYAGRKLGKLEGMIYRPVPGSCRQDGAPPEDAPVVLLLHGNGYHISEYSYLASHLAANGFVVVAAESDAYSPPLFCDPSQVNCIEDRAHKGVAFLRLVQKNWNWAGDVDFTNIGIVGHSQGGEAAVEAARIIRLKYKTLGNPGVGAVVALAPSDLGIDSIVGRRQLNGRDANAFLVLYGSRDEDVKGWDNDSIGVPFLLPHATGFALYDRAGSEASLEGIPISVDAQIYKSMQFIYGANHQRFSDRIDHDVDETCWPALNDNLQKHVTKGFANGFLRWWLLADSDYDFFFDATLHNPWGLDIYPQYSPGSWGGRRVIDNFQHDGWTSTIGGSVVQPISGNLIKEIVDNNSTDYNMLHGPENGQRLKVTHSDTSASNLIHWNIPASQRNAESFTHLSLRIGQGFGADSEAVVGVRIRAGGSWSSILFTDDYGEIPEPDYYGGFTNQTLCGFIPDRTVTHMRTIRIPLDDFGIPVDQVQAVQLRFTSTTTIDTEIYVDNLEFVGGTGIGFQFGSF